MLQLEVEKNPKPPNLSKPTIELLTKLCFRRNDPLEKVDGIFVFSTSTYVKELTDLIINLIQKNLTHNIFITGGVGVESKELGKTQIEAKLILETINKNQFSNINFFTENISTNSLENVTEMLKVKDFLDFKKILFIFKAHAAGRGYLTLRRFLPNTKILQKTFCVKYPNSKKEINRDNWHTFNFGSSRVWGEYLRIKKYGQRGDIEYEEIKDLVKEIENSIK